MKSVLVLTILLSAFYLSNMSAQDGSIGIEPNPESIASKWELWLDKVPISGNVRVGLMIESDNEIERASLKPKQFFANIPKISENDNIKLCAELSSKDGRYSARLDYPITAKDFGNKIFILPTKYEEKLAQFGTNEVAILASLSNDCNRKPDAYVLSSWYHSDLINEKNISVYVNLISKTSLAYKESDSLKKSPTKCITLDDPKVAYNKKCTISLEKIKDSTTLSVISSRGRGSMVSKNSYKLLIRYFED